MDSVNQIVTRLPLAALWDDNGALKVKRKRALSEQDISALLRLGPVRFVVADVGEKLRWVEAADCYGFWKEEVKPHIAEPEANVRLGSYPGQYCYFASEWNHDHESVTVVALERTH